MWSRLLTPVSLYPLARCRSGPPGFVVRVKTATAAARDQEEDDEVPAHVRPRPGPDVRSHRGGDEAGDGRLERLRSGGDRGGGADRDRAAGGGGQRRDDPGRRGRRALRHRWAV